MATAKRVVLHQFPSKPFRRKDGRVRSRVLAITGDEALIEARWGPQGKFSNRLFVHLDHMEDRYGVSLIPAAYA